MMISDVPLGKYCFIKSLLDKYFYKINPSQSSKLVKGGIAYLIRNQSYNYGYGLESSMMFLTS